MVKYSRSKELLMFDKHIRFKTLEYDNQSSLRSWVWQVCQTQETWTWQITSG